MYRQRSQQDDDVSAKNLLNLSKSISVFAIDPSLSCRDSGPNAKCFTIASRKLLQAMHERLRNPVLRSLARQNHLRAAQPDGRPAGQPASQPASRGPRREHLPACKGITAEKDWNVCSTLFVRTWLIHDALRGEL